MGRLTDDDMDTLLGSPLFSDMRAEAVATLLDAANVVDFPESGLLFSKGDVADRFFVVLEGRVDLFALTEAGDESVIEVFDKGWTFAEAAMFASGRFPLNAQATAGTRLLQVPKEPFMRRLSENRDLALKMLAALSRWHGHLLHEIDELKRHSPVQRLAVYLLYLAKAEEGAVGVRLPVSKTLLASRIGMAPESLSRAMARLKGLGVEMKGRDIVINDVAALRRFCEGDSLRPRA